MKVTKLESKKLNEEELRSNQNMHEPEDVHIHADLAYGVAREVDTAAQEHAEEVFDELEKNAEGITPKTPDDGNVKMEKNMYTEKITLDESLFTEDAEDGNEIAEFLKDSVEWLIDEQMGCSTYKLNDRLGICVGWQDGFDANDEDVIHSSDEPTWAIVAGIKVYTSDDMRTDYDWISYPYFANGDTVDTSVSVSPNEDYDKLANYFVGEFDDMKDWEIEEDGLVIESDNGEEDADVEESCNSNECKELTEKKGEIEELPDNVWQLVYDRLFPGNKNFRPKIATNINKIYDYEDSIIMNSGLGVGDWDIGVAVAKEEDSDLAKAVADELHLATEYRPTKMLRGRSGVIIIKIPEDIATKDASEYVTSIGLDMATIRPKRGKK